MGRVSTFQLWSCPTHGPQYIGDLDNRTAEDEYACGTDVVVDGAMDLCPEPLVIVRPRDDDGGVTYTPWSDGWAIGFKVEFDDGRVDFIYLNPSGGSDDNVPTVFLYRGTEGDVTKDGAEHHYVIGDS